MRLLLIVLGLLVVLAAPAKAERPCDVALVLVIDASGSVDAKEWETQIQGIAEAFLHRRVWNAIKSGAGGRIAVAVTQFSDTAVVALPWRLIETQEAAFQLAADLWAMSRDSQGSTAVGEAMLHAVALFDLVPCEPTRRVIDISGDGEQNWGRPIQDGRVLALNRRITVNGLPIDAPGSSDVYEWYDQFVKTGDGAFVVPVLGFERIKDAMITKLANEIAGLFPYNNPS